MANFDRYAKLNRVIYYNIFAVLSFVGLLILPFFLQGTLDRFFSNDTTISSYNEIDSDFKSLHKKQMEIPYHVIFESSKQEYAPYEEIFFSFSIIDKASGQIQKHLTPVITLSDSNDNKIQDIFNRTKIPMLYSEEKGCFIAAIHINNILYTGKVNIHIGVKDRLYKVFKDNYTISIRKPKPEFQLPHTYTFLGFDSKDTITSRNILFLDRKEISAQKIANWFRFLNNDAVIMPSAFTKYQNKLDTNPWNQDKLKESKHLAKEFSKRGVDVALWIEALEVDGNITNNSYKVSSTLSKIDRKNDVISLLDDTRKNDIKLVFKDHMIDPNISYVGFSKVFFQEMQEELYENFLHLYGNNYSESNLKESFQKWKNIQFVEYFRSIFESETKNKPIFFMFTGDDVANHPEYVNMAYAAGVDFIIIDIDTSFSNFGKQFDHIQKHSHIDEYKDHLVLSYCLNYKNVASTRGSVIDNWIEANLILFNRYNINAIRVNDFCKAMFGERGPYSSYEWILSIGELISRWKRSRNYYPLSLSYTADSGEISDKISVNIELHNSSLAPLKNVELRLLQVSNPQKEGYKYSVIYPQDTIRMNITLEKEDLYQSLVQKKTKFLGLQARFLTENKKEYNHLGLISFIDPDVIYDPTLSEDISESERSFEYENFLTDFTFLDLLSQNPDKDIFDKELSVQQKPKKPKANRYKKTVSSTNSSSSSSQNLEVVSDTSLINEDQDLFFVKNKKEHLKKEKKSKISKEKSKKK